jgi:AraC-like DNA-binding protein
MYKRKHGGGYHSIHRSTGHRGSSSMGLAEISERCGYESEPAFRKAFRKTIGKPLGAFRTHKQAF